MAKARRQGVPLISGIHPNQTLACCPFLTHNGRSEAPHNVHDGGFGMLGNRIV